MKTTGGQLAYRRGFRIPVHCLGHERVEINRDAAFEVTSLAARDYFIPWIPLTSPLLFFSVVHSSHILSKREIKCLIADE